MIELARHIEVLLLENDCVIIPGFGGFITHHSNAKRIEEEQLFLPPTRTIGFNPQLRMNDGLLVQSYMQAYDTDFSDASRMVDKAARELINALRQEGMVNIHGIGEMRLGMNNNYNFHPNEDGLLTPGLYGLSSFEISVLKAEEKRDEKRVIPEVSRPKEVYEIRINRALLRHTVAAAAAIITFFFLSVPVENTYVEEENYAMLGTAGLFENIREQSVATTLLPWLNEAGSKQHTQTSQAKRKEMGNTSRNLKPVSIRTEKVAPRQSAPERKTPAGNGKAEISEPERETKETPPVLKSGIPVYNIIVASVTNKSDALKTVEQLKSKGYSSASVIEGNGKIRISLMFVSSPSEAYKKINQFKENGVFKDAWLLTSN